MVWYSHLLKNFPQFVVIHTVKGFGIVNKAEIDVFLAFFDDPVDVSNLIPGSSAFSKSGLNIWRFTYCGSLVWRILSITLLACEMSVIVRYFEHSLVPCWVPSRRLKTSFTTMGLSLISFGRAWITSFYKGKTEEGRSDAPPAHSR